MEMAYKIPKISQSKVVKKSVKVQKMWNSPIIYKKAKDRDIVKVGENMFEEINVVRPVTRAKKEKRGKHFPPVPVHSKVSHYQYRPISSVQLCGPIVPVPPDALKVEEKENERLFKLERSSKISYLNFNMECYKYTNLNIIFPLKASAGKVQAEPSKQARETEKKGDTEDEHCQLNNSCQLLQLQAQIVAYYMLARKHPLPSHVILAVSGSIFDKTDAEFMSLMRELREEATRAAPGGVGPRQSWFARGGCGADDHNALHYQDEANMTRNVQCTACGGVRHTAGDCKQRRPGSGISPLEGAPVGGGNKTDLESMSLMVEVGVEPTPPAAGAVEARQIRFAVGSDDHNALQGHDEANVTRYVQCTACGGVRHTAGDCKQKRPAGSGFSTFEGIPGRGEEKKLKESKAIMEEVGDELPPPAADGAGPRVSEFPEGNQFERPRAPLATIAVNGSKSAAPGGQLGGGRCGLGANNLSASGSKPPISSLSYVTRLSSI